MDGPSCRTIIRWGDSPRGRGPVLDEVQEFLADRASEDIRTGLDGVRQVLRLSQAMAETGRPIPVDELVKAKARLVRQKQWITLLGSWRPQEAEELEKVRRNLEELIVRVL